MASHGVAVQNKCQQKAAAKHLRRAFAEILPDDAKHERIHLTKSESVVALRWQHAAKCVASAPDQPVVIHWNAKAVHDLSIPRAAIQAKFEAYRGAASASAAQWSV